MKIKTIALLGFVTTSIFGMSSLAAEKPLWVQGFVGKNFVFGFNEEGKKKAADYQLPHHFSVEIDGKLIGGLSHGTEFTGSQDVILYKDGEDGTMHTRPGHAKIKREYSGDKTFRDWFEKVRDGKVERRSISVIFHNDAGEEAGRINLYNCWPTGYKGPALNAKDGGHAKEAIELSFEKFDLKK